MLYSQLLSISDYPFYLCPLLCIEKEHNKTLQPIKINNTTDERYIVERAATGDNDAFQHLIQRHQPLMLHVARAIIGNVHAEDVAQEAWLSAYKALPRFEFKSSFKTWILTIVSNEAKSRLRRESRQISLEEMRPSTYLQNETFKPNGHWKTPPPHWHTESPDALLEEKQLEVCIKKTLDLLPNQQKAAFILRELEQCSFTEICSTLSISASNARVLTHRARLTLMQVIDHYQETGTC